MRDRPIMAQVNNQIDENQIKYTFLLTGKIKPYVRTTRQGKFVDPQAQEYLASQEALRWQLRQQMTESDWQMLPGVWLNWVLQ